MSDKLFYYGSAREMNSSVSCFLMTTGKIKFTYNLSDYSGEHSLRKTKHSSACWDMLQLLKQKALMEAKDKLAYATSRRKETVFEQFRYAFCCTAGRGGSTIYVDEEPNVSSKTERYVQFSDEEKAEIARLGIPYIDSSGVKDGDIWETINFPMIVDKPGREDRAPWGGLSYAPLGVIAALYMSIGAVVKNVEADWEGVKQVRGWTEREAAMLAAYTTGNETALGALMLKEDK